MDTSNSWQRILASARASDWANGTREELLRGRSAAVAKRTLDVAMALAGLVLLSPLLLGVSIAVKLESSGPVLYISRRVGRNGRVFRCFKFRTMTADGQETRLGQMLRHHGLDELPQLANVLCAQMSVVGPRPVVASDSPAPEVRRLRRFEINPGMTGLWAIQQAECPPFRSYISPDETYRRNWSVWLDVVIVMRSLGAALAGRGR